MSGVRAAAVKTRDWTYNKEYLLVAVCLFFLLVVDASDDHLLGKYL